MAVDRRGGRARRGCAHPSPAMHTQPNVSPAQQWGRQHLPACRATACPCCRSLQRSNMLRKEGKEGCKQPTFALRAARQAQPRRALLYIANPQRVERPEQQGLCCHHHARARPHRRVVHARPAQVEVPPALDQLACAAVVQPALADLLYGRRRRKGHVGSAAGAVGLPANSERGTERAAWSVAWRLRSVHVPPPKAGRAARSAPLAGRARLHPVVVHCPAPLLQVSRRGRATTGDRYMWKVEGQPAPKARPCEPPARAPRVAPGRGRAAPPAVNTLPLACPACGTCSFRGSQSTGRELTWGTPLPASARPARRACRARRGRFAGAWPCGHEPDQCRWPKSREELIRATCCPRKPGGGACSGPLRSRPCHPPPLPLAPTCASIVRSAQDLLGCSASAACYRPLTLGGPLLSP